MTVESNYVIAIATLSDWLKRLAPVRAVFKRLSKVITWLRLLRLLIGLKDSRQFFNQWNAKPKPIAPCTRDFSRASSELQVISRNCDWLIALFAPVVIGRSNCFGFGFSTVIWKLLYSTNETQNQNQLHHVRVIFSRASSELQAIAGNCDWFIACLFLLLLVGVIALVLIFNSHLKPLYINI